MTATGDINTGGWTNALYRGAVMHRRLGELRHSFRYRVFSLLLDLDDLPRLGQRFRLFRHNGFALLSVHDRDHGARDGSPLRPWVDSHLRKAGLGHACGGRIRLLCFPRLWGFVFNPLSVYFCDRPEGGLAAILYEVRNTFGESHGYLLPVKPQSSVVEQSCAKAFYVSPFIDLDGSYRFRVHAPDQRLMIAIRQDNGRGQQLHAILSGERVPFDDRHMVRAAAAHPLMTLKVIMAIHWEAFRLWLKGAVFHRRPVPPPIPVSYGTVAP